MIDSHFEASSNYKVRNKVILQAPAAQPGSGTAEIPAVTPDTPSDTPVPMEPTVPAEPAAPPLTFLSNRRSRRNRNGSAPQLVRCKQPSPSVFKIKTAIPRPYISWAGGFLCLYVLIRKQPYRPRFFF